MGENAQILIKHNRRTVRKFAEELAGVFAQCESLRKNLRKFSHFSTACGRSSGNFLTFQRLAEGLPETFSLFSGLRKIFRKLSHFSADCERPFANFLTFQRHI